jgi:pyruvate dehydrogenase E1 component alpha subunit
MPEELLATFVVKRLSILDLEGNIDEALMPLLDDSRILEMHRTMLLARTFDERALALQREGRLGTYPPILGQEAAQVGSAFALNPCDWVFPSFRETGVHLALGYPITQLLQYWSGDERGLITPERLNVFPVCVSVGSHIPHAVGAAMASRYRRDRAVMVCYFGDGATSKGDFHEGFNMAGVFRLPVVFICQNNQWAISVPLSGQTAAATLAQKAVAYGFEGVQVDGNDVFAVYRATQGALDKARSGGGPTFIECLTYRMADHTTSDDSARYRSPDEVESWRLRDPLLRLERFLARKGLCSDEYRAEMKERSLSSVDAAVQAMETLPPPLPADFFNHTLAHLTPRQSGEIREL